MIMFQFILSSLIVTLFQASFVESFASQLAQKCDIPMEVGVLMMGTAATFNETYRLQLFREDRTELNSGGITATRHSPLSNQLQYLFTVPLRLFTQTSTSQQRR